jgi:hypothetical protein
VSKTVQRKVSTSAMVFVRVCDKSMHGCACCECAYTEGRGDGGEGDVAQSPGSGSACPDQEELLCILLHPQVAQPQHNCLCPRHRRTNDTPAPGGGGSGGGITALTQRFLCSGSYAV